jgi:hypothetical protein
MNNVITASRINTFSTCARKHFWRYEVGWTKESIGTALKIGSAWARAMEARWLGANFAQALEAALPEGVDIDGQSAETVAGLLAGYYFHYGTKENCGKIHPEVRFGPTPIPGTDFVADGVMDGLGELKDSRLAIVESKTTRESVDANSDFWNRLKFNVQILQYAVEAPNIGWQVDVAYYDVTRKPAMRPKMIDDLDAEGNKIVIDDSTGQRAYVEKGPKGAKRKELRKSGGEGFTVQKHLETPAEFGERLYEDTLERPEFYFARKEIPLTWDIKQSFIKHRLAIVRMIEHCRENEIPDGHQSDQNFDRDPEAWPRNVSDDNCFFCNFKSFCLDNIHPDPNHPPAGFSIKPFNPELEREEQQNYDAATQDSDSAA